MFINSIENVSKVLEETHKALLPVIIMIFVSSFIGWSAGISQNSCNPYFEDSLKSKI